MSAQPSEHDGHDVIRLGGEAAVVVQMHEYQTLKALRDRASAEQVEEARDRRRHRRRDVEGGRAAGPEVRTRSSWLGVRRLPVRIIWSQIAQATFVRFVADQAGMMAVNRAGGSLS